MEEVLAGTGELVSAKSGEEALRHLLREEFAVILLDVLMPGIDGYETAALIRQREQSRRTPIIFLTAVNKEQAHMLRGYDAGAVDFVFKPFDPLILRSKVTVFVELFEKTREIREQAAVEQRLIEEKLNAQAAKLSAEQALLTAERRQAAILKSLPIAVYVEKEGVAADFVGGDIDAVTGFSADTVRGNPDFWLSRVHPDDRNGLVPASQNGGRSREYRWRHADGSYRNFLEQAVPIGGGQFAGTVTDVTERRQLESRLMQAQRLDAIGKLTGGLAHDFNNLLAAILSGIGLLERRSDIDQNGARILEMIGRSARQGAELVNRMLSFSRRQQLRPASVALAELSDTMTGLVAPVLGGLVKFEWRIADEVWPVHVDVGQLELAMMNLVFNARDAMASGGTITVVAENRSTTPASDDLAPGDYVMLAVKDTGCGIEPDLLSKVVEPFFTTKAVGKGTGLGLSTVYGFARQSGGTLRIDSVVGQGTTMELWLPRSTEAPKRKAETRGRPELPKLDGAFSVLLVDDSANLLELTAQNLVERGFSVTTAAGGAEALQLMEKDPRRFDVIVTDFAMPLVSGLDVVRFARRLRADWPAVIITGYADSGVIKDRPVDVPVLVKPFSDADLADQIIAARRSPA
ncbi:MAG: hybrid sensor histidine kinase/response regulator [Rhizobiaceae bacterium]|nr:hybrid sensor histidine kinase/response regulator [Rhizobiaceae bacterium]